ncbi:MAG: hypothetical protein ABIN89_03095 [Chitinophagaceae bacterium]
MPCGLRNALHNRNSFATYIPEKEIDIGYIKDILGKLNIKTTQRYRHVGRDQLINIFSAFDDIILTLSCNKSEKSTTDLQIAYHKKKVTKLTEMTRRFGITELNQTIFDPEKGTIDFDGPKINGSFKYININESKIQLLLTNTSLPVTLR